MKILGLSLTGSHDSAAAIVVDGQLVAAAEEERFTRAKHEGAVPFRAIDFCLEEAGIRLRDVDVLAFPAKPFRTGKDSYLAEMEWELVRRQVREGHATARHLVHKGLLTAALRAGFSFNHQMEESAREGLAELQTAYGPLPRIEYYDHHQAHAAAAYLTSGEESGAVVTCDGVGWPYYSTVVWRADGTRIERRGAELFPNSLGLFYEEVTTHLGLGQFGQGKMMGLAPYGEPESIRDRMRKVLAPSPRWYRYTRPPLDEALGFPGRAEEPIMAAPYRDAAAAAQEALEESLRTVARDAVRNSGTERLFVGGGVALNCSANGMLRHSGIASAVTAFAASGDAGLGLGAALLAAVRGGSNLPPRITHAYWGPRFDDAAIERALLEREEIAFHRTREIAEETAEVLASGGVVGWFQGRMEFGPRALGNRSILADPRSLAMRDRVNRLKGREQWRPLAPSVLAERAAEFFELSGESPYMLFAAQVRPDKRALIPAVVHVDGSARPQTVTGETNPAFHALLSAFQRRTGIPILLNTSFNGAWEPIVCTPSEAVETFLACGLDALVLGDFLAVRRDLPEGTRAGDDRPLIP
jgi:carbamoyltransferase